MLLERVGTGWVLAVAGGRKSFSAGSLFFILGQISIGPGDCLLGLLQNLEGLPDLFQHKKY